ncbi:MAG: DUF3500 domain-containing protein, partial [Planctomycetota bacterium]
ARLADAVSDWTGTLDETQRKAALFPLASSGRTTWDFLPDADIDRPGLSLADMTDGQRSGVDRVLLQILSVSGFEQAAAVRALEEVLAETEPPKRRFNKAGEIRRDPLLYRVAVFGEPAPHATWSWRFEGHHLSINATVVDGRLRSVTPSFFGSNPSVVGDDGPARGGRPAGFELLADERAIAVALVESFDDGQRSQAVMNARVPKDIISRREDFVSGDLYTRGGLGYADMGPTQRRLLLQLVDTFRKKYRPDVRARVDADGSPSDRGSLRFVWIGGMSRGERHYFSVTHSHFVVEYACVQDANHVHAVWRDFDGDFAADVLGRHLRDELSAVDP